MHSLAAPISYTCKERGMGGLLNRMNVWGSLKTGTQQLASTRSMQSGCSKPVSDRLWLKPIMATRELQQGRVPSSFQTVGCFP